MDFGPTVAVPADFAAQHHRLSNGPESGFVRVLAVYRRDATGVDVLKGCVLHRAWVGARRPIELSSAGEWFAALADVFGLTLADVAPDDRAALWHRVRLAHQGWAR